ncbi:MAG: type 1 glutamine amidotransferase [Caulobacteraceae bacterium]|nr:type 1 glutamine amidotransferase [Caulobacteraceae bacterium]
MKIGILETGAPPEPLRERFGGYPDMFRALLGPGFEAVTIDVAAGRLPRDAEAYPAYVITGSAAGVYDDLPWIAPLMDFLRGAKGRVGLAGICFGHQIMAQAFGGQVIKSPKGWGVGLHTYEIQAREPWMDLGMDLGMDQAGRIAIPASHQDQVVSLPPGAVVTAASAFTPYAGLAYDDGRSISFQGHPEFDPAYAAALIEARRGVRLTEGEAVAGLESLTQPNDRHRVGQWLQGFLRVN